MPPGPFPSLNVRFGIGTIEYDALALVDTGFDGHLALTASLIPSLPAPRHLRRVRMASGQVVRVPAYVGRVELTDQPGFFPALIIALGDEYLIGIEVLNHYRVTFDHGK